MAEVEAPVPAELVPGGNKSSSTDKDALIARLDMLLEQYLHTFDSYEKLMQQLSKQLSSGFFSLTQANFHNRSGVHYGQDSYDERVQATRKILVAETEESRYTYSTISTLPPPSKPEDPNHTTKEDSKSVSDTQANGQQDDTSPAPEPSPPNLAEASGITPEEKEEAKPVDPIRMFGILVPPALRAAQTSFRDAVDGPVVKLAAVTGELRALEREIGRVRKAIRKA